MEHRDAPPTPRFSFDTHPDKYRHWKLAIAGDTARLTMSVREEEPLRPGYVLKLNSYDLGVDIELVDAVQRLRFEHPEVKVVIVSGDKDKVFCAGANIHMLASSTHPFKVNFCKFTNETRLSIEDASAHSGQKYLAAVNGACAGGGYELAMACDEIVLVDDGSSSVSLPEVPLLGVLPGTGGLTRLVDKRKVRRDHADVFSTLAEGIRGKRAVDWRLVDAVAPRSKFDTAVSERAQKLAATAATAGPATRGPAVTLDPVAPRFEKDTYTYRHVTLAIDKAHRTATLTVRAPDKDVPETPDAIVAEGASFWPLRMSRELDDALLQLRFFHEEVAVVVLRTAGGAGAAERVLAADRALATHTSNGFVHEVRLHLARTLRRLDATARSFFAVIDQGSCFVGTLLELALAADRSYMLEDPDESVRVQASPMNGGAYPMSHGATRLAVRFLATPARTDEVLRRAAEAPLAARAAEGLGLVTVVADDIDFADEVRVAVEERASLSPDALTGMEQNLRFCGPESPETKIFGRLSAWQNWIFIRDNATGERGALTLYGKPERPEFDRRRT
jgi:benzoyl-CoA-dihydrodiol lyase